MVSYNILGSSRGGGSYLSNARPGYSSLRGGRGGGSTSYRPRGNYGGGYGGYDNRGVRIWMISLKDFFLENFCFAKSKRYIYFPINFALSALIFVSETPF